MCPCRSTITRFFPFSSHPWPASIEIVCGLSNVVDVFRLHRPLKLAALISPPSFLTRSCRSTPLSTPRSRPCLIRSPPAPCDASRTPSHGVRCLCRRGGPRRRRPPRHRHRRRPNTPVYLRHRPVPRCPPYHSLTLLSGPIHSLDSVHLLLQYTRQFHSPSRPWLEHESAKPRQQTLRHLIPFRPVSPEPTFARRSLIATCSVWFCRLTWISMNKPHYLSPTPKFHSNRWANSFLPLFYSFASFLEKRTYFQPED